MKVSTPTTVVPPRLENVTPADAASAVDDAAQTSTPGPLDTFDPALRAALEREAAVAGMPLGMAAAPAGATIRQAALHEQVAPPIPDDLAPEVQAAAAYLWRAYPDAQVRDYLSFTFEEDSAFDMNIDSHPDEQRIGKLMSNIPLPEVAVEPPLEPMRIAALEVETTTEHKVANPLELFAEAAKADASADIVIAPEWLFVAKDRFYSAKEFDSLVEELRKLSAGSDRLLVPGSIAWVDDAGGYHNTALAFADGELVKRYDKRNDGDDIDFADKHGASYARGSDDALFEWRGRTVGLEVCRDHGDARLRWDLEGTERRTVDIQLVVSSGVDLVHTAVGLGGLAVVSNGDPIHDGLASTAGRRVPRGDDDHPTYAPVEDVEAEVQELKGGARVSLYTA